MLSIHGDKWHQEVHAPSSWVCPLCTDEEVIFSKSYDLIVHLEQMHEGIFTEPQIQAISNQSRFQTLRPRGNCPLCCLPIRSQGAYLSKGSEDESSQVVNPRSSGDAASSNMPSFELIGSHVAAHLQSIMLLALRLISIDVAVDVSNDSESTTNGTENRSSWTGSGQAGIGENLKDLTIFPNHDAGDGLDHDEMSTESDQILSDVVPETEYIDWDYVSLRFESHIDKINSWEIQEPRINAPDIQPSLAKNAISEQDSDKIFLPLIDSTTTDIRDIPRTSQWNIDHNMINLINDTRVRDFLRGSSPGSGDSYACLFCEPPEVFYAEAAFERHVKEEHQAASFFNCKLCSFKDIHKDALHSHVWYSHLKFLDKEEVSSCEIMEPVPETCKICVSHSLQIHPGPFQSWESWFEGIESHCLIYPERRQNLIRDFILSEQTFQRDMRIIQDIYQGTVHSCPEINSADIKILFGNCKKVLKFSSAFLRSLKQACSTVSSIPDSLSQLKQKNVNFHQVTTNPDNNNDDEKNSDISDFERYQKTYIGQTFMEHISRMEETFGSYLKKNDASQRKLGKLITGYPGVSISLNRCRGRASYQTSVPELQGLLDRPKQQLIYYRIFLSELAEFTPQLHPDRAAVIKALEHITEMPNRLLDMMKRMDIVTGMLGPAEPESSLRASISKIFKFRTDRPGPEASPDLISTPDDTMYTLSTQELENKLRDNYFRLKIALRDFEKYKGSMRVMLQSFKDLVHSFIEPSDKLSSLATSIHSAWRTADKYLDEDIKKQLNRHVNGVASIHKLLVP